MTAVDGPALSWREQQILDEVENALRTDAGLDRVLRTMRPRLPGRTACRLWRVPGAVLAVLLAVSASLLLASSRAHSGVALTVFGPVWLATAVVVAARLAARPRRRRWRRRLGR